MALLLGWGLRNAMQSTNRHDMYIVFSVLTQYISVWYTSKIIKTNNLFKNHQNQPSIAIYVFNFILCQGQHTWIQHTQQMSQGLEHQRLLNPHGAYHVHHAAATQNLTSSHFQRDQHENSRDSPISERSVFWRLL